MPQLVPHHNWSPRPSTANYVAVDGPPGPSMAAMDGPLCCKWSPGSKPEKQWLHANIDRVSDYKKLFRNNAMQCLLQ